MLRYIIHAWDSANCRQFGSEVRRLSELSNTGLPVPAWVVLTPTAFYTSLSDDRRGAFGRAQSSDEVLALLDNLQPGDGVMEEIAHALSVICPAGERIVMRPATADGGSPPRAARQEVIAHLAMPAAELAAKVAEVWRRGFSEQAFAQRREHGLSPMPPAPAIIIQRLVDAGATGRAFSADPTSGNRATAVVEASYGLDFDEYHYDTYLVDERGKIAYHDVASKRTARFASPDHPAGAESVTVSPDLAGQPALDDHQVYRIAAVVRDAARCFGRPQQIRWAIEGNYLYVLDAAPIETPAGTAECAAWDRTPVEPGLSGVVMPLTFTFARHLVAQASRRFYRKLGISAETIIEHDDLFQHIYGLIQGRIYAHTANRKRLMELQRGFRLYRRFTTDEPEEEQTKRGGGSWSNRGGMPLLHRRGINERLAQLALFVRLVSLFVSLSGMVTRFLHQANRVTGMVKQDLSKQTTEQLLNSYRTLDRQLIAAWELPLIAAFFTSIFTDWVCTIVRRSCGEQTEMLMNDLLYSAGESDGTGQVDQICRMAQVANNYPDLVAALCNSSVQKIEEHIDDAPDFRRLYHAYLDSFGDCSIEALKLESPPVRDEPLVVLRAVGQIARSGHGVPAKRGMAWWQAEQTVRRAIGFHPLRRLFFDWACRQARRLAAYEEQLHQAKVSIFERVRAIMVEFGNRLYAMDLLASPDDVFYLELDEVLGALEGTAGSTGLRTLVAARRSEFVRYREMPIPPRRLTSQGKPADRTPHVAENAAMQAKACCPGTARGPVRIIREPGKLRLRSGDIAVIERLDQDWHALLLGVAGIIVEDANLPAPSIQLLRSAGLPVIAGLAYGTETLKNGEWVELDGQAGIVRRIDSAQSIRLVS